MKKVIYVHGKGGNAAEAEHFRKLFADCEVVGFDYKSQSPREARDEFLPFSLTKNNPSRNDLRGVIFMRGFLLVVFMARILHFRDEFNAG